MKIKSARYATSAAAIEECPGAELPEFAFIGRSNVGKSSLINMLTGVKNLAMTSSKPGKTLLINHFLINEQWHLVDLPGYGYARIGKQGRERLEEMIRVYITKRVQLTNLFVLIDSRHEPQQIDIEFITWLGEEGIPFSLIFTKSDKLSKSALQLNISQYKEKLYEVWEELPPIFVTSSEKGIGRDEVLQYIAEINASL